MNRIFHTAFFLLLFVFQAKQNIYAQRDSSTKKRQNAKTKVVDSLKNVLLTNQSEEFQALKTAQMGDSIRLLELKKELLLLGSSDKLKKEALATEQNQIQITDSLRTLLQKSKIDSLRSRVSGFPVTLGEDTIFYIYAKLGSYSPKERAETDMNRIYKLSEDYYYSADSLNISASEFTTDILYEDEVLLSISDLDALWMNDTKENLAEDYKSRIANAIRIYKAENSWSAIARDFVLAVLVLAVLSLIIFCITRLFRWVKTKIEKLRGTKLTGFKIRNYQFLDTNRQVSFIFSIFNILKWIIILVLIYLTLPVLFGIFPWTGGLASKLISYFLDPIKHILFSIWNYLPNFFTIIILFIFFRYLLQILLYFKKEIEKDALKIPGFYIDWANPTYQIIRLLILAFALIVIFPYLPGSDSQIFKGVSVFLGVLFTFGSAGALSNVVAGLVLTYMRAYKIGDRVKIGEATGDVVEKSLLVTKIKTVKNEVVSIPNSSVMGSHTTNFSAEALEHGLILHTTVTIGYENPWKQIHELLIKAALATDLIEKDPTPFVFQTSLDDFYVSYEINAYTRIANMQHITYSLLHQNIQDYFNAAGVEIMSAHYKYIRDGNQTTVPENHLPKDYVTPSFRVKNTDKGPNG